MAFTLTDHERILLEGYLPTLAKASGADLAAILERIAAQAASDLADHEDGSTGKHDATEIDYERGDGSKKNILAGSDTVEAALTDLDDATGALASLNTTVKTSIIAAVNEIVTDLGKMGGFGVPYEAEIVSGDLDVTGRFTNLVVLDVEGGTDPTDDLSSITGLADGQMMVVRIANAGRNVVIKSGVAGIECPGGFDVTLDLTTDLAVFVQSGASTICVAFNVLTLSNGGLGRALASAANGQGASRVAIEDAGNYTTTADVEAFLQELGRTRVRRAFVNITAPNVRTLNATPVQLVAAPGAGFYLEFVSTHWWLDYGTVGYDAVAAGDDLTIKYTNASGAKVSSDVAGAGFGDGTSDKHAHVVPVGVAPVENAALVAHILVGEWYGAAGDSPLIAEVYYRIRAFNPGA